MQAPIVHLNGTSKQELMEQYSDAIHAMHDAIKALQRGSPNMRDYYVKPEPGAFTLAVAEHQMRIDRLQDNMNELEAIREEVYNQQGGRP